ncbi:MAG: hypothetical protein DI563_05450 [Variovorax paradoxus]|uniref:Uncharacterized protein n=1 Tax=Variovorax paradoxus TaxID=34073 RepID=A0A2W5S2G8_VARPD|nr:MAG: hypothetical protein DI563_05450 [Variovorax paradoxus]
MNTIDIIKADIAAAQAIIDKAQPLAVKLAEMQAAAAAVAGASRTLDQLRARLADAETAERIRAAAVAGWTIENIQPEAGYSGPAGRHTVTASRIVHGLYGPQPTTQRYTLSNMPVDLMAAVLADAERIPACIRALDADPEQALRKHAQHVGRGYMAS